MTGKPRKNLHYLVNILRGRPSSVSLELTYRCNLHCVMCNVWRKAGETVREELDTDELKAVVDQLYHDLGVRVFRLVGAEPFLRKDLLELIEYIKSLRDTEVHVVTNGIFTDLAAARRLVELGLDYYKISLDGIGEVNDRVRGLSGGYATAVAGIKALNQAKKEANSALPRVHVLTTVTAFNEDEFSAVFSLRDELGIADFNLGPAWQLDPETVAATVIEGEEAATDRFLPRDKSWKPSVNVQAKIAAAEGNPLKGTLLQQMFDRLLSPFTRTMKRHPAWNCHYRIHLIIDPVGDVLLCPVLDGYPLGNVREESLRAIISGPRMRAFARTLRGEPTAACRAICGGGMRQEAPRVDIRNMIYYVINRWSLW